MKKNRLRTILFVDGIRCNHCESSIKLELGRIPGVKRIKIAKRKEVTIEFKKEKMPDLELELAIESMGYKVIHSQ